MSSLAKITGSMQPKRIHVQHKKLSIGGNSLPSYYSFLVRHAIVQTFSSGFLFDMTTKILKKKELPENFSFKKKEIMSNVFVKERELFSLFKTIFLCFPDYGITAECISCRGDFIFATNNFYRNDTKLLTLSAKSCDDSKCLTYGNKIVNYNKKFNGRHNMLSFTFDVVRVPNYENSCKAYIIVFQRSDIPKVDYDDGYGVRLNMYQYVWNNELYEECYSRIPRFLRRSYFRHMRRHNVIRETSQRIYIERKIINDDDLWRTCSCGLLCQCSILLDTNKHLDSFDENVKNERRPPKIKYHKPHNSKNSKKSKKSVRLYKNDDKP